MELFYREYGQGPVIIILHGLLGISDNWVSFARRISEEGYKVFIPDQRNHGQSPQNPAFNYYALSDDLAEFIDKHSISQPLLMGHSMGGKVVMRYTLENPDKVKKLVVVDTSLRSYNRSNYHRDLIDAMLSVNLETISSRQEVDKQLLAKVPDERLRQFLLKNLYWKDRDQLGWRLNLQAIGDNLDSMYDGVFYSGRYEGPSLFIKGGKSDYITEQDYPAIKSSFPLSQIKTIPEGTHWVHADAPVVFYKLVKNFISS